MIKVFLQGEQVRQKGTMSFLSGATAEQIDDFLSAYSKAGVLRATSTEPVREFTPTTAEALSNVDYQCVCHFRDTENSKFVRKSIPAIKAVGELSANGKGRVLTAVERAAVLALWETCNQLEGYILQRGRYCQKK